MSLDPQRFLPKLLHEGEKLPHGFDVNTLQVMATPNKQIQGHDASTTQGHTPQVNLSISLGGSSQDATTSHTTPFGTQPMAQPFGTSFNPFVNSSNVMGKTSTNPLGRPKRTRIHVCGHLKF